MSQFPDARFILSANAAAQFVPDTGSEVAVAGRSNAGKSSAINVIVNRRQFARTSKTPGRTQLVNFFELRPGQRLVDLPGYGFAKVSDRMRRHWGRLLQDYFESRQSLKGLLLVVDIRRRLKDFDEDATQEFIDAHPRLEDVVAADLEAENSEEGSDEYAEEAASVPAPAVEEPVAEAPVEEAAPADDAAAEEEEEEEKEN